VARRLPAVDASVEENEALENVNVVVKILGVHNENVLALCDVETPWLSAVVMEFSRVDAHLVRTLGALLENVESLLNVTLQKFN